MYKLIMRGPLNRGPLKIPVKSQMLLRWGLRILSTSGGPSGAKPGKATSQRTIRQKSQSYNSQETAPTVFEIPLNQSTLR